MYSPKLSLLFLCTLLFGQKITAANLSSSHDTPPSSTQVETPVTLSISLTPKKEATPLPITSENTLFIEPTEFGTPIADSPPLENNSALNLAPSPNNLHDLFISRYTTLSQISQTLRAQSIALAFLLGISGVATLTASLLSAISSALLINDENLSTEKTENCILGAILGLGFAILFAFAIPPLAKKFTAIEKKQQQISQQIEKLIAAQNPQETTLPLFTLHTSLFHQSYALLLRR